MSVPFALVDAFTDTPFRGNTAGVVTAADGLTTAQMQQIARELRQTETCFVSSGDAPGTDFALRWFTPTVEVDLCGHATVAAFACLAEEGRIPWREGRSRVRCAIRTGAIDVWLEQQGDGPPVVMLSVGVASLETASDDLSEVAEAVGLAASEIDRSLPLARDAASARLLIPVTRLADLLALKPNALGMVVFGEQSGYRRFTLLCRETEDPANFVHLRHFAPANGIPEDPVTGTAHGVVVVYLNQQGLLPEGKCVRLTGEQGHAVSRKGAVEVEVHRQAGRISDVRIGGGATVVARGQIIPF